jgi:hypothetical protein
MNQNELKTRDDLEKYLHAKREEFKGQQIREVNDLIAQFKKVTTELADRLIEGLTEIQFNQMAHRKIFFDELEAFRDEWIRNVDNLTEDFTIYENGCPNFKHTPQRYLFVCATNTPWMNVTAHQIVQYSIRSGVSRADLERICRERGYKLDTDMRRDELM